MSECGECERPMVMSGREWATRLSADERAARRARGQVAHKGRGLCHLCHLAASRARRREEATGSTRPYHAWGEVWEESEFLFGLGESEVQVAKRLGIQIESLRRSRQRYLQRNASAA